MVSFNTLFSFSTQFYKRYLKRMRSPVSIIRLLHHLQDDTAGMALSSELVLVATILVAGLIAGTAALRDAVISEISDVGGAVQDLQHSYDINGLSGHSSSVAGMSFLDSLDHCDDAEDAIGVADNCITFEVPPSDELAPISTEAQVLNLSFDDGNATDTSPEGTDNSGVLVGDPEFVGGGVEFDGDDAILIPNSSDINLGIHEERTISITFNTDDVTSTQVLYEEGATVRGLVIYIDDGLLYIGGWNIPTSESGWNPVFISTPISGRQHCFSCSQWRRNGTTRCIIWLPQWLTVWLCRGITALVAWRRNRNRSD